MIIQRNSLIKFLFFLFLLLHAIPLVLNENYQLITILNYSAILFSLLLCSFNNKKMNPYSVILMSLIFISLAMSFLGFSGTISSLIMAASLPHFLFRNMNSKKHFLQLFYQPIILCSTFLIFFSAYLYFDVRNVLDNYYYLGEYFIIASINYVSLLFISFSVLLYLLIKTCINHNYNKQVHSLFLISFILLTMFYSSIFLTRIVFACSLLLMYAFFKKTRILISLLIPIIFFYNVDTIIPTFINFFGSGSILEIASDYRRIDSISNLINSSLSINFDFRNQMSYSSLINLIFSLFPLTLVFLYNPFSTLIIIFKKRDLTLFLVFLSCFILVVYQMDFFSIFTFFFFMEYVKFFVIEKHAI